MPLTVTVPATASDLITLDDLPAGVRSTANDPYLATLIRRASAAIPRYLGRVLARQTYREDVPGYGDTVLQLFMSPTTEGLYPGGPLTTLTSVQELDTENGSSPTTITDALLQDPMAGLLYRKQGWHWTGQIGGDLDTYVAPQTERPLFRVVYIAGYTLPSATPPSEGTLPWDIRAAAVQTVVHWFYQEGRDQTVTRRRIGDVEVEYGRQKDIGMGGIPQSTQALLSPWRRIV